MKRKVAMQKLKNPKQTEQNKMKKIGKKTNSQTDVESFVANLCCDWLLQLKFIFTVNGYLFDSWRCFNLQMIKRK